MGMPVTPVLYIGGWYRVSGKEPEDASSFKQPVRSCIRLRFIDESLWDPGRDRWHGSFQCGPGLHPDQYDVDPIHGVGRGRRTIYRLCESLQAFHPWNRLDRDGDHVDRNRRNPGNLCRYR